MLYFRFVVCLFFCYVLWAWEICQPKWRWQNCEDLSFSGGQSINCKAGPVDILCDCKHHVLAHHNTHLLTAAFLYADRYLKELISELFLREGFFCVSMVFLLTVVTIYVHRSANCMRMVKVKRLMHFENITLIFTVISFLLLETNVIRFYKSKCCCL